MPKIKDEQQMLRMWELEFQTLLMRVVKIIQQSHELLKIVYHNATVISPLRYIPKVLKIEVHTKTYEFLIIVALFVMAQMWKQKCLSTITEYGIATQWYPI